MSHLTQEQYIGHIDPSTDHISQTAINSLTTQRMLDKHVQPDSFTPPLPCQMMRGNQSLNYYRHLNHNLHRMKQVLAQIISLKCKLTWMAQNLSCRGHTPLL